MSQKLKFALIGATALSFGAALVVQSATMVKDVEVSADLAAIVNPQAAAYWTSVADDLENAIAARITDRTAPDGVNINIDLSEIELSNSFQEALNIADTKLVGDVKVTSDTDNTDFNAYNLTVNVDQAMVLMPEGTDLSTLSQDSTEFYQAMISAFADAVVVRLD
jgi:hypothetical protein